MLLSVFRNQVGLQCEFALMAAQTLDSALQEELPSIKAVFFAIQNLLNAAANVQKALWGQGGRLANERKALRDSIGISDKSPLRQVEMRNNFEHLDDRIDEWWTTSPSHNFIDMGIFPASAIAGADPGDMFRRYDPTIHTVYFWGEELRLGEIVDELHQILVAIGAHNRSPT